MALNTIDTAKVERLGENSCLIKLAGRLEFDNFIKICNVIYDHLDQGIIDLTVDLAEVDSLTSGLIAIFISANIEAEHRGGGLRLVNVPKKTQEFLDFLGVADGLVASGKLEEGRDIPAMIGNRIWQRRKSQRLEAQGAVKLERERYTPQPCA